MTINPRLLVLEGLSGSGKTVQAKRLVERLNKAQAPAFFNAEPTKDNPMPFGKMIRQIIEGRTLDREMAYHCIKTIRNLEAAQLLAPVGSPWAMRMERAQVAKLFEDLCDKLFRMAESGKGENLLTELELQVLFLIDRMYDLYYTINPKTAQGYIVVEDRFELTTFTCGGSRGLAISDLWDLQLLIARDTYSAPVLTVVLKVDPKVAAGRLQSSGKALDRFEEDIFSLECIDQMYPEAMKFTREKHMGLATASRGTWYGILAVNANSGEMEVADEIWRLVSGIFLA